MLRRETLQNVENRNCYHSSHQFVCTHNLNSRILKKIQCHLLTNINLSRDYLNGSQNRFPSPPVKLEQDQERSFNLGKTRQKFKQQNEPDGVIYKLCAYDRL